MLDPLTDCPRNVHVTFDPPAGSLPGERGNCDISVYATPKGLAKAILVGGVTVQAIVPHPCQIVGAVVDKNNRPIPNAKLSISRPQQPTGNSPLPRVPEKPLSAVTDDDGHFTLRILPSHTYLIAIQQPSAGRGKIEARLECGSGKNKFVLAREGVTRYAD